MRVCTEFEPPGFNPFSVATFRGVVKIRRNAYGQGHESMTDARLLTVAQGKTSPVA